MQRKPEEPLRQGGESWALLARVWSIPVGALPCGAHGSMCQNRASRQGPTSNCLFCPIEVTEVTRGRGLKSIAAVGRQAVHLGASHAIQACYTAKAPLDALRTFSPA
jgi:hypothetical protein